MTGLTELYRTAEKQNISVDCFALEAREALSVADGEGGFYIAIDPLKLESSLDEKMKLAHELGHCCTGSFYNRYAARDLRARHENRADKWAILTLIPEGELREALDSGLTEPWELAEHFEVSEELLRKAVCWYTNGSLAVEQYY